MNKINLDDKTMAFLTHLWRGGKWAYWWYFDEVRTYVDRDGVENNCKETAWVPTGKIPGFVRPKDTEHTYFGVNPDSEKRGKGERSKWHTVSAINCVFADFDGGTGLETIEAIEPTPSAIVETSPGKYHVYWLINDPFMITDNTTRQRAKSLQSDWTDWLLSHGTSVANDSVARDLSRVLRLPGTPNVKQAYAPDYPIATWVRCDMDRTYTIDDLSEVCAIVTSARAAKPRPSSGSIFDGGISVISEFNARYSIDDMLTSKGYEKKGERWKRPGGSSYSVWIIDGRSYHHSASDPVNAYANGHTLDAFELFTFFEHNGDRKAAVRDAADRLGIEQTPKTRVRTERVSNKTSTCPQVGKAEKPMNDDTPVLRAHGIGLSSQLSRKRASMEKPIAFPVEVFPPVIRNMVQAVAATTETTEDMVSSVMMGIMGSVANTTTEVQRGLWYIHSNIFSFTFVPSGEGKSPVFEYLRRPILDRQRENNKRHTEELKEWRETKRGKGEDADPEPVRRRLFVTNITTESLQKMFGENDNRMSVMTDEGRDVLSILTGRYAKQGHDASLGVWCGLWEGSYQEINRVSRDEVVLDRCFLSICATAQTDTFERIAKNEDIRSSGFLPRCLISIPQTLIGKRQHRALPPRPDIVEEYNSLITRRLQYGEFMARLSPDAFTRMNDFAREIEPRLLTDLAGITDFIAKIKSHIVRIATCLMVFDWNQSASEMLVDVHHVERAIKVIQYYMEHWLRFDSSVHGESRQESDAIKLVGWLQRMSVHPQHSSGYAIGSILPIRTFQSNNAFLKDVKYTADVLAYLCESGILEEVDPPTHRSRSRFYRILSLDFAMDQPKETMAAETTSVETTEPSVTENEIDPNSDVEVSYNETDGYQLFVDDRLYFTTHDANGFMAWCDSRGIVWDLSELNPNDPEQKPPSQPSNTLYRSVEGYD